MSAAAASSILGDKWDLKTQTPHGGQDWVDIPNFVEDFSVTTNALSYPEKALHMSMHAAFNIHHYPPSNYQPALNLLCKFLVGGEDDEGDFRMSEEEERRRREEEENETNCFSKTNVNENKNKCLIYNNTYLDYAEKLNKLETSIRRRGIGGGGVVDEVFGGNEGKQYKYFDLKPRILLGNGASELIELAVRATAAFTTVSYHYNHPIREEESDEEGEGGSSREESEQGNSNGHSEGYNTEREEEERRDAPLFRPGPFDTQYKEYERCAVNENRRISTPHDKKARLLCIVNPCNPTGEFMPLKVLKSFIEENCASNTAVLVDESMLPWLGPHWRMQSLVSQREWVRGICESENIKVYVIHSWTKLWACPGLRIGSLVAPTVEDAELLKKKQTPWSMNTMAVAFLSEAILDREYLRQTWISTAEWRRYEVQKIKEAHPDWIIHGEPWLSFIWIDTRDEKVAEFYVLKCKERGVPIRWGKFGYERNNYIRIAVRNPAYVDTLMRTLSIPRS